MEMANRAYTKELLTEMVHLLDIRGFYEIEDRPRAYSVIFYSGNGYCNIEVRLRMDLDFDKSAAFRKRHADSTIYNIAGFDMSVVSLRTDNAVEAEFLLRQYQDAMKIASLFSKIAGEGSVLVENF